MMLDYDQLRDEVHAWANANFGPHEAYRPLLGIVEELGELVEAETKAAVADAIGDVVIFMADYCGAKGWSLASIAASARPFSTTVAPPPAAVALGRLAHAQLKAEQGIRGTQAEHDASGKAACAAILRYLHFVAVEERLDDVDEIVAATWARVRQRSWREDPARGGEG